MPPAAIPIRNGSARATFQRGPANLDGFFKRYQRATGNTTLLFTLDHSPEVKYFLGGNMPRLRSSLPQRWRICSVQFTQFVSLKPRKCRTFSYGANPR